MKSPDDDPTPVIVLMGVSGVGKTEIGRRLAQRLGWSFVDADEYHSPQNIRKMSAGQPLSEEDRLPWLADLRAMLLARDRAGDPTVLACSALRAAHRDVLRKGFGKLFLVHLEGSIELISKRLESRRDHFFDSALLQSQLDTLEPPGREEAVTISIEPDPDAIVDEICNRLEGAAFSPFCKS